MSSFRLFVIGVLATAAAEFAEFEPLRRRLFILSRNVVPTLANAALEHNIIARHKLHPEPLHFSLLVVSFSLLVLSFSVLVAVANSARISKLGAPFTQSRC
jgi:hypothetical protein